MGTGTETEHRYDTNFHDGTCSCKDFEYRGGMLCKHLLALCTANNDLPERVKADPWSKLDNYQPREERRKYPARLKGYGHTLLDYGNYLYVN